MLEDKSPVADPSGTLIRPLVVSQRLEPRRFSAPPDGRAKTPGCLDAPTNPDLSKLGNAKRLLQEFEAKIKGQRGGR